MYKKGKPRSKSSDSRAAIAAWEKYHRKKLPVGHIVAHLDNNPENNSRANLKAMTIGAHNTRTKKGKGLKEQARGVKNKPNKPVKQRRFR